ncbi:MAG: PilZ domain-containing protein [Candidatus Acidiferrales bacterium]
MTERRLARRFEMAMPVVVSMPHSTAKDVLRGEVRDISTSGLYFHVSQPIAPGTKFELSLSLPIEIVPGSRVQVLARARAVRLDHRMEGAESQYGIAAAIEHYDILRPRVSTAPAPVAA